MIRFRFMIPLKHSGVRRKLVPIVLSSTAGGHPLPLCNYAGQNHPAFVNRIEL